jgi:hypothetical protein
MIMPRASCRTMLARTKIRVIRTTGRNDGSLMTARKEPSPYPKSSWRSEASVNDERVEKG